jgi:hypothetical protein
LLCLAINALLSNIVVVAVSEVAKRHSGWGALIASLPPVSILGMIWLWRDTRDPFRLATHTEATFWFVLPSLPMFLLVPLMLRQGYNFLGIAARWMRAYRSLLCSSDVDRPQVRDTALGPIAAFI